MSRPDTGRLMREVQFLIGDTDRDGLPDGQLLDRFVVERDEAAFERLVRRYGRLVFAVCRRVLADSNSAEDAFQATFLVLVHKARSLDRRRPVGDWLYTVAFRLACRARANEARRREREANAARSRTTSFDEPVATDVFPVLYEELNRLPERHREVLVLSYLEGRTYEQVARAIGCPLGTVGWRLSRAKEALRDRLTSRGVASPAAAVALLATATTGSTIAAPLLDTTIRAGLWFAGERTVGDAVVSPHAIQLARSALRTATTSKIVMAASVAVAVAIGGGTMWLARSEAKPDDSKLVAAKPLDAAASKTTDLPPGATARLGSAQFRHGEAVFFIAYTTDGKHIVTAGRDHTIRLWERETGREVREFERAEDKKPDLDPKPALAMPGKLMMRPARDEDFPVALSPDGKLLAAGKGKTITVWDVEDGKRLHALAATVTVTELFFTPGGKSLVAADVSPTVTLWDPTTGKATKTFAIKGPEDTAGIVRSGGAVSPTGTHFVQQFIEAGTGNATLRVHDLATGEARPEIRMGVGGAQGIAFSPDGKYLAWSNFTDGITVWDVPGHKQVAQFGRLGGMKYKFFGNSIAFTNDSKTLAATLANDDIELWDVATGKPLRTVSAYVPEGGPRGAAQMGNRVAVRIAIAAGGRMTRSDLVFSPDGKAVAASLENATIRQFDTGTGNEIAATAGHLSGVIATGSDGRTVVTVSKESVRVWDASGKQERQWPLAPPAISAAVSRDAKLVATSSAGGVVRLWDAATGKKVRDVETKRADAAGLGFSPDGKVLATKSELNAAVNLWDTATGNHIRTIGQDGEPVLSGGRVMLDYSGVQTPVIAFSPDGRLIAAAGDKKQLSIWDAATGSPVSEILSTGRGVVYAFAFSENGHAIVTLSSSGTVTGYEIATGEKRYEFKPTGDPADTPAGPGATGAMMVNVFARGVAAAGGLGFTADGRYILAGASNPAVRVWDTVTGQEAGQLKGHLGSVSTLRAAADGKSFVSGSVDTTALVWDVAHFHRLEVARDTPMAGTDLEGLWSELAKPDASAAFEATRKFLTDRGPAVEMLKDRLRPVPKVEDGRIDKLVADLAGALSARRKAAQELERLGELAVPQLRKALEGNPALEFRQRVERLLEKATVQKPQGDQLREVRAIELLELAATPEAKKVLESLAAGAPGARLTREAAGAISRMSKQ